MIHLSRISALALFAGLAFSTNHASPSAEVKEELTSYGFEYGKLNHLGSVAAFDQALGLAEYIIVKCGADWCGPCRQITPVLEQLAREYTDILIIEVNIDAFPGFKSRYGFRSIPATFLLKNGSQTSRTIGFKNFSYWSSKISSEFGL